jgi:hypothetical protein
MSDTVIRKRLRHIIMVDMRNAPEITASSVTREYVRQHGIDGRVRAIAAALLEEMFDPLVRAARADRADERA